MLNFQTSYDQAQHRITLTKSGYLDYTRSDESSLIFDGVVLSEPVKIRLKKIDTSKYLLLSRGFHWINELPFNR